MGTHVSMCLVDIPLVHTSSTTQCHDSMKTDSHSYRIRWEEARQRYVTELGRFAFTYERKRRDNKHF